MLVSAKNCDWFDKNIIKDVLSNKNKIRERLLENGLFMSIKQLLERKFYAQRKLRGIEETLWFDLAVEILVAADIKSSTML